MLPHVEKQLKARGLNYSEIFLLAVAKECPVDTAVVLNKLDTPIPYKSDAESNGDLVVLIVRNQFPVTIMLRRSNQDRDKKSMCKALDVREVKYHDWRK